MREIDPEYFESSKETHSPDKLWIGCSDARVPSNIIMGEKSTNVFVHRNIGNLVVNTDVNLMAVI